MTSLTFVNIFTLLTEWFNPIRIDAKPGSFCNPVIAQWVYYMWSTMMPAVLNKYISRENIWRDLRWKIKENTTLNKVHNFIEKANIDQELILYIRTNHQTYRFIYSTLINRIYYFVNEEPIQNQFIQGFTMWQANTQGGGLLQPQPLQYPNVVVERKPLDCSRQVDKFTKGLNKTQRDRDRKIALEQRLTEIKALGKKHENSEKEFQNSNLRFKLRFKL